MRLKTCNGSRIVFVGGLQHTGTTIMQHTLLQAAGYNCSVVGCFQGNDPSMDPRFPGGRREESRVPYLHSANTEGWPPTTEEPTDPLSNASDAQLREAVHAAACSRRWLIYKKPLHNAKEVEKMLRLTIQYPAIRLVYMKRDLPNYVWSVMLRANSSTVEAATIRAHAWCLTMQAWSSRVVDPSRAALDWSVELSEFSARSRSIVTDILQDGPSGLEAILWKDNPLRQSSMPRCAQVPMPPDCDLRQRHAALRGWQVQQPVYDYDDGAIWRQAPPDVQNFLRQKQREHCDAR